ncbi:5-oxoprolinase subunit PxpB [Reichenbachiella agarivorans]|uniref:5-oxoprolinase subunit PxpB n=1 Tax=Reichenbachiella agarivorans TaxID=2979464 RepID=A0ABY6CP29_9BACT|nr:5-oxoprolinase subunit PxpB [Reichenbachiella agarivorans]UXP32232.1 5-oxoprolinase subunit PxpB [Reichenbachiella agarivorans]
MESLVILPYGDQAVLIQFEQRIDVEINRSVHALNHWLLNQSIVGVVDSIPAYCSLTLRYNPDLLSFEKLKAIVNSYEWNETGFDTQRKLYRLPVCYGGDFGQDMSEVSQLTGLSFSEIVDIHGQSIYHTFMIGFLPGFPYLGKLDAKIQVPRRQHPRTSVASGSVGLAGEQTGVYPSKAPGGWQIIGRTPIPMMSVESASALLRAGDQVQFFAVTSRDFELIQKDVRLGHFNNKSLHVW